ncbi:MAG: hypothetical protein EA378_01070 [Phycisphaerales bacterium]|nr:MAG: hypothetical protein EA378_01070 [Phycisphaerales bacterium]
MLLIKLLNRASYALCLLAVVFAAGGAIWGVWNPGAEGVAWRSVATALIICAAAGAVIAINGILGVRMIRESEMTAWLPLGRGEADPEGH